MSLYSLISKHSQSSLTFLRELDGTSVTYQEFFHEVDKLSEELLSAAGPAEIVVIDSPKSIGSVVVAFASIKSGLGYCFIDPALPAQRKQNIITAVNPALTYEQQGDRPIIKPVSDSRASSKRKFSGGLVFTSGSTGTPKGVLNSYEALTAYVDSMLDIMPCPAGTQWLSICPAHFDVFQLDFLVQSARGACVVIAPHNLLPQQYIKILSDENITEFLSISTLLKMFVDGAGSSQVPSVVKLYYGGEGCSVSVLDKISPIFPNASFCQFYGPTENCNNSTFFKFNLPYSTKTGFMPLGHPIKNVKITLRNEDGEVAAPNQSGQICISGQQLLSGYLYVDNGHVIPQHTIEYESGDYGHLDTNGLLWFEGRKDDIGKVNGNRVSLAEINAELSKVLGATSTVATIVVDQKGYSTIVSGYASDSSISEFDVYRELTKSLPRYALPKRIFSIEKNEVRVLSTGKTDLKQFKALLEGKLNVKEDFYEQN